MIDPVESQAATLADLEVLRRSWPTGPRAQAVRRRIVERYLPYVYKMAARYARRYRVPVADLIQDGVLAVYRAIDLYDETKGTRFMTYAHKWMLSQMTSGARRQVNPVSRGTGSRWDWHTAIPEEDVAIEAPGEDPALRMDAHRVMDRLRRRAPRLAQVLEWRHVEDLDYTTIADRMGCSKQNAHMTVCRAEREARRLMGRRHGYA